MSKPEFQFQWSTQAADHNWALLARHNFDLTAAINTTPHSPLTFGSEFRHPSLLNPLLSYHPLWPRVLQWLTHGVTFPLKPLPEQQRQCNVALALQRGNHQSVKQKPAAVKSLLQMEVICGWQLPLPRHLISKLPGVVIAPLGLVSQSTINSRGEHVPKHRLTHDQSFNFTPGSSVNSRVIVDVLTPCCYGTALRRFIHYIVDLRHRHPTTRILLTKLDFKAAYRRLHFASQTATQAVVIFDQLALLALRLTFGGAACPSQWSDISEITCDTCNLLSRCPEWVPEHQPQLESPHQSSIVGPPQDLPEHVPIQPAQPTVVPVNSDDFPFTDCYLDDLFTCFLDTPLAIWRGARVALLLVYLIGRPIAEVEPLPRDDLLSFDKLLAEGTPEETKHILGWEVDTRRFLLRLPVDKHTSWTTDIHRLLQLPTLTYDDLATTIGRFNHAAYVVPTARAFLCHLRRGKHYALKRGKPIILDPHQRTELKQWLFFLAQAREGLNLNLLTLREPTIILRADACEHGVGGYSMTSGVAWRYSIPQDYWGWLTLNLLEYIASVITIAVALHTQATPHHECLLSQLDSTTADYWLLRGGSRFYGVERNIHLTVSCWLSTLLLDRHVCTYSQWVPGDENVIADSLSRDHHLTDTQLTHLLQTLAQPQPNLSCPQIFISSPFRQT